MNYLAMKHSQNSAVFCYESKTERQNLTIQYKKKYPTAQFKAFSDKEKKEALKFAGVTEVSKPETSKTSSGAGAGVGTFKSLLSEMKERGYDYVAIRLVNGAQYCIWLRDFVYWPERGLVPAAMTYNSYSLNVPIRISWNGRIDTDYVPFDDFETKLQNLVMQMPALTSRTMDELRELVLTLIYEEYSQRKQTTSGMWGERYKSSEHLFGVVFANKFDVFGDMVLFENVFESVDEHALHTINTKGFKKNVAINTSQICAMVPYRARTKITDKNWLDLIIKMEKDGRIV